MKPFKPPLPQLSGELFLTDGGIETTLIFQDGLDLPYFAAFDLLRTAEGRATLERYYYRHAGIAMAQGTGFVFESATWRASTDWGVKLGYSRVDLAEVNRQSVALMERVRASYPGLRSVLSGCIGPRGDGYEPGEIMSASQAERYHSEQIKAFSNTAADMITALTMTNVPEAIGVTRAAQAVGLPVVVSFTVETDGRLPTGDELGDAIQAVDWSTGDGPVYYMINGAHPDHFRDTLAMGGGWLRRIAGIRANASRMSHTELDEAEDLDDGNPEELGRDYADLRAMLPHLVVLGGGRGTDHRHIGEIGRSCLHKRAA